MTVGPGGTLVPDRLLPEPAGIYLESKRIERGLRRSTVHEYRRDLEDFCRWLAGRNHKPIGRLTLDDFASVDCGAATQWVANLNGRKLAPVTRARRLSTVSGCFRWLASQGLIPHDPFAGLE